MASVNRMIVLGHLGRDPEVRYTPSGAAVCNITIATSRNWKNKESGEKMEETEWHRVVLYDRQAEIAGEYLKKGRPVYIEGRLKTRKWTDKDGVEKYTTEIIGESMQLLGSREDAGGNNGGDEGSSRREAPAARSPAPAPDRNATPAPAARQPAKVDFGDDDIPF